MPVYCDNAATSFPKPKTVIDAICDFLRSVSGSPGRSAHSMSIEAGREVLEARESLAAFFNCPSSDQVIFTANATEALNLVIMGLLKPGDHVVASSMEHNSVMRPLEYLRESGGVDYTLVPADDRGRIRPMDISAALRRETKLICVVHASNVTGGAVDIGEIGRLKGNALLLVDAAQSAGVLPIDMVKDRVDFLAFTGHKSLYGPTGVGGLCLLRDEPLNPLKRGGTGSRSESLFHPEFLPDRYESGTPNSAGIVGLKAGVQFIREEGLDKISSFEAYLTDRLIAGLREMRRVRLYGPDKTETRTSAISFNVEGKTPSETCLLLDKRYGIMARCGLQCAPLAHKTIGTFPQGTVRLSPGYFNTMEEIDQIIAAVDRIAGRNG